MSKEWLRTHFYPLYFNIPVDSDKYEHVTPFLDSVMIPIIYCTHKYLEKADVLFLRNMVWKICAVAALKDFDFPGAPRNMWKLHNELSDTGVRGSYLAQKKAELDHSGYSVLINVAELMDACYSRKQDATQLRAIPGMKLGDFLM